jgi:protocatechuate 3,4-dioxygenase beta subunit
MTVRRPPAGGRAASFRPAHIHFMIGAPGYRTVTHLFIEGDEYLESDAVFGLLSLVVRPELAGVNTVEYFRACDGLTQAMTVLATSLVISQ